jgi:hypothetical protein
VGAGGGRSVIAFRTPSTMRYHIHNCVGNGVNELLVIYITNGNNSLQVLKSHLGKCFVPIRFEYSYNILNMS